MSEKVVVTGLGTCTSLGATTQEAWAALTRGHIAPGRSPCIDGEGFDRAVRLAERAMREAMAQAQIEGPLEQFGCTVSASKPLFREDQVLPCERITEEVSRRAGCQGESRNVIAACATGAYSIALAASWIEQGICDVALAGSVEPTPHPLIRAGFAQMGVLSADGSTKSFDKERSGFAMGEGAGIVVLESESSARARHQTILAQLSGWALGADGHSAVAFNSDGQHMANVIGRARAKAKLAAHEIRHVNAHGTATRHNDWIETQSLRRAFGSSATNLMISATKSSTGHLLGAAGSVEFILTVLALQNQFVPPTAQLKTPDPACALDYTPGRGHAASFEHALSLSFGFGGSIAALVVSR